MFEHYEGTCLCVIAGHFQHRPVHIGWRLQHDPDAALRALDEGQWEILDLTGKRDFLFATDSVENWLANT